MLLALMIIDSRSETVSKPPTKRFLVFKTKHWDNRGLKHRAPFQDMQLKERTIMFHFSSSGAFLPQQRLSLLQGAKVKLQRPSAQWNSREGVLGTEQNLSGEFLVLSSLLGLLGWKQMYFLGSICFLTFRIHFSFYESQWEKYNSCSSVLKITFWNIST